MENSILVNGSIKKCSSCGGNLEFSPHFQCLVCKSCSRQEAITKDVNFIKHEYNTEEKTTTTRKVQGTATCNNCGAKIKLKKNNVSGMCPYCNTPIVMNIDQIDDAQPDFIIPFTFEKEQANEMFKKQIRKKHFIPNKLKKSQDINSLEAFYFPCFSFYENTNSIYQGRLVNETTHTNSQGHSVTHVSYQRIAGKHSENFENILVETSSMLEQSDLNNILPYNTREMYKFDRDFLLGYSLEYANESVKELKNRADNIIDQRIRDSILSRYSYTRVDYLNVKTIKDEEKYSFGALPAYRVVFNYKNKKYTTLLNGQTGKLGGKLPRSGIKITALVLAILLPILIIIGLAIFL